MRRRLTGIDPETSMRPSILCDRDKLLKYIQTKSWNEVTRINLTVLVVCIVDTCMEWLVYTLQPSPSWLSVIARLCLTVGVASYLLLMLQSSIQHITDFVELVAQEIKNKRLMKTNTNTDTNTDTSTSEYTENTPIHVQKWQQEAFAKGLFRMTPAGTGATPVVPAPRTQPV